MRRLGPGVYDDGKGGMHLELSEILAASHVADTPANRAALERMLPELLERLGLGDVPIETTDEPL